VQSVRRRGLAWDSNLLRAAPRYLPLLLPHTLLAHGSGWRYITTRATSREAQYSSRTCGAAMPLLHAPPLPLLPHYAHATPLPFAGSSKPLDITSTALETALAMHYTCYGALPYAHRAQHGHLFAWYALHGVFATAPRRMFRFISSAWRKRMSM